MYFDLKSLSLFVLGVVSLWSRPLSLNKICDDKGTSTVSKKEVSFHEIFEN